MHQLTHWRSMGALFDGTLVVSPLRDEDAGYPVVCRATMRLQWFEMGTMLSTKEMPFSGSTGVILAGWHTVLVACHAANLLIYYGYAGMQLCGINGDFTKSVH